MIVPGLPNFTWVIQLRYMYMDKESQSYLMTKHNITLPLLGSNQRPFLLAKVYDHWAMCSTCLKSINNSEMRSFTFQSGSRSTVYIYFQLVIWRFTNPIIIIFYSWLQQNKHRDRSNFENRQYFKKFRHFHSISFLLNIVYMSFL